MMTMIIMVNAIVIMKGKIMIFKHSESKILHDNSVVRVISISINPLHTSQDTLIKSLSRDKIQIFKHSS